MNAVVKRSGITKRIYPHLLRHTRAPIYASKVAQRPPEMQMGWVLGTSMGDILDLEEKFKLSRDIVGKFAGILIGNIPLFYVSDSAFLSRLLIVGSNPEPIKKDVPDLDKKIWKEEGDKIVAYLLNRLRALVNRNFVFANQFTYEKYEKLWELLSDAVKMFMDEYCVFDEQSEIARDDMIDLYKNWCGKFGIILESDKRLAYNIGKEYLLKQRWDADGQRKYKAFTNCALSISFPREAFQDQKEDLHDEEFERLKKELDL